MGLQLNYVTIIKINVVFMEMKMDNFYEILDLIYQTNKKYPDLRFGQIVASLHNPNVEDLFYLSDEEIKKRLEVVLEEDEV
jgi:hypothetical protein